ncbi:GIY-YIG nuclease family protein [Burkholderia sp. PU8-34]
MSWFLYLIECADGSVYTGITTDVAARFDEHAAGKGARYTRSRKPRAVLASFPLADRSSALRAEYRVKQLTAAQKRELAAGVRTLESVLPVVTAVDEGAGDGSGKSATGKSRKRTAGVRRGRAPKGNMTATDTAAVTVSDTAGKNDSARKRSRSVAGTSPTRTGSVAKAAPKEAASVTGTAIDESDPNAAVRKRGRTPAKTSPARGGSPTKVASAQRSTSKKKASATGATLDAAEPGITAPTTGRTAARKSKAPPNPAAKSRSTGRAAPASAPKKTARAKQNRAVS